MFEASSSRKELVLAIVLFSLALAFHAWGASVGWSNLNLPGCEFRQTQTAISAFFIQRENNFSLAYPTPVLGKPWSIPMEFPLYQWTVVVVSNTTGMALTQAGRAVTLACFYLGLPAVYLLLLRLGLTRARALIVLGVVVGCPLYIYYGRSFLIETMAWMFGAWFLLGYVKAVEKRSLAWWTLATVAGVGVGLVKITTFICFLMPAFAWTLVWFWQDFRQNKGRARTIALARRFAWCALSVAISFAVAYWWIKYSDAIKAKSVAGAFLQSDGLSSYNFGVGVRFAPEIWRRHWAVLFYEIASVPVLIACGVFALLFARRWWWVILALIGFFFAVQIVFPILYAWHEYYYVANAMLLMVAMGLALCGLLESRLPRVLAWLLIVAVYAAQATTYATFYYTGQKGVSPGGSDLTLALRQVTDPDDVLIIAGDDWSSMIPYFAQRRAYMVRRNLERTWDIIMPAFDALRGESVTALVLYGDQRNNEDFRKAALERFHIDPRPVFTWGEATVYLKKELRAEAGPVLQKIPNITIMPDVMGAEEDILKKEILVAGLPGGFQRRFDRMSPKPWKYYTTFGIQPFIFENRNYYSVHPDSRLWFKAAAGERKMTIEVMIWPEAYAESVKAPDRSDGVEIKVWVVQSNGERHEAGSRQLNPRDNPSDRGLIKIEMNFPLPENADIELAVLPGPRGSYARDWTMLGDVVIK